MGMRAGILAALLALVLGSGAVAQSPSPEASPWYAPDDLTTALPARVGDYELQIGSVDLELMPDDYRRFWQELLAVLGVAPEAMRQAYGIGHQPFDDAGGIPFDIKVVRIVGMPATSWVDDVIAQHLDWTGPEERTRFDERWQVIAGRHIWTSVITPEAFAAVVADHGDRYSDASDEVGFYLYPKGEVMFALAIPFPYPQDAPTVAEILAGLP